jgi:exonuclease SbcC
VKREGKNTNVKIRRGLRRDKRGILQEAGWIEINGHREEKSPTELRAIVLSLLGYPQEYLRKDPIIFRYTVYTPQDDMKRIMFDPDTRAEVLRKLFDIEKYGRIKTNTEIFKIDLRSKQRELLGETKDLEQKIKRKEEAEQLLKNMQSELGTQRNVVAELGQKVIDVETKLENIQKEMRIISENVASISRLSAKIEQQELRLQKARRELDQLDNNLATLHAYLMHKPQQPAYSEDDLLKRKESIAQKIADAIKSRGKLESEIAKLNMILERGLCEVCGQPVSDPKGFREKIEHANLKLTEIERTQEQCNAEIEEIENALKIVREYAYSMQLWQHREMQRAEAVRKRTDLEREIAMLETEIENNKSQLAQLEQKIVMQPRLAEEEQQLKAKLRELKILQENANRTLAATEKQAEMIAKEIATLEEEISKKLAAKERAEKIGKVLEWLDGIFIPLVEQIERTVLGMLQAEFNNFFQSWFGVIMGDEGLAVHVDESFNPLIEQAGYQTEYQNLSGGEKTAVALAYRLALNKVVNSLVSGIATKDLIILDEPTDGFSSEQIDRIRDVLVQLGLAQILIVSHEPKIDSFVDNVIRFYKVGDETKVMN